MSPVKLVHVLKRIEILERDISELKELDSQMPEEREYSQAMRIAIEHQINNLLNERTKLMDLRIENPPEHLVPGQNQSSGRILKPEPGIRVDELSAESRPVASVTAASSEPQTVRTSENKRPNPFERLARENLSRIVERENRQAEKDQRSRKDILSELPPIDY